MSYWAIARKGVTDRSATLTVQQHCKFLSSFVVVIGPFLLLLCKIIYWLSFLLYKRHFRAQEEGRKNLLHELSLKYFFCITPMTCFFPFFLLFNFFNVEEFEFFKICKKLCNMIISNYKQRILIE